MSIHQKIFSKEKDPIENNYFTINRSFETFLNPPILKRKNILTIGKPGKGYAFHGNKSNGKKKPPDSPSQEEQYSIEKISKG